jgi:hypothetical protein
VDSIKDGLGSEYYQNRTRVIVIANEESVATYCSDNWWNVEGLEIDDALDLFRRTVTFHKHPYAYIYLLVVIMSCLHKCYYICDDTARTKLPQNSHDNAYSLCPIM